MKLKELQTIDAEELASQPLPPPSFIVDGLIPYGLCVLAGPSKCGKSWLMLWLCMRVSQGLPIWERKTQQCDVLYLCLEDTYARIQRRMYRLNEESVPELRLGVISEKLHCGLEEQIEQHLSKYPNTKLVVIDTLQKVRKPNSADSNMYAADYEDISALKRIADLESIANRVLRAYWKIPEAKETPWYVDPDLLLCSLLGLKIEFRHLSTDGLTLGVTSFDCVDLVLLCDKREEIVHLDGKTVLIEQDLQDHSKLFGRRNFTLSHEASHHILNLLFPGEYTGGDKDREVMKYRLIEKRPTFDWEEWQMDVLASYLLMPTELIKENMRLVGLPDKLDYLNPKWRRQEYERFTSLSDLMGVSKDALSYRMQRLGLIGEDQRRHPNDLLDVWRY